MSEERASGAELVRRASQALDRQSLGLWLALAVGLVLVVVLGVGPTLVAVGLLALLVVD